MKSKINSNNAKVKILGHWPRTMTITLSAIGKRGACLGGGKECHMTCLKSVTQPKSAKSLSPSEPPDLTSVLPVYHNLAVFLGRQSAIITNTWALQLCNWFAPQSSITHQHFVKPLATRTWSHGNIHYQFTCTRHNWALVISSKRRILFQQKEG